MLRAPASLPQQVAFFISHSAFLLTDNKKLQQNHYSSTANSLILVAGVTETSAKGRLYRYLCPLFS